MDKCELNVVGLSEVRWTGKGEIVSRNYTMFYAGRVKAEKCVAVVLRNDIVKRLTKVECFSDRLTFVKSIAKPFDIVLVQVYMPTTSHDDDEVKTKITTISEIIHQEERRQVNAIVMGHRGRRIYK